MNLSRAIALAAEKFKDRHDKAGQPYILHCLRVMNDLHTRDQELQCIAVLHDIVEDTDVTLFELQTLGFSDRIVRGVDYLTHKPGTSYDDYIKMIAMNSDAREVKMSDLRDNSNITRLKGLTKKDHDRIQKYHTAYVYLSKI